MPPSHPAALAAMPTLAPPTRVLVVDDDAVIRQIATLALSLDPTFEVHTAASGALAFATLENTPFDVIILDMMMPGMDGQDVLERLRAKPALAHIPVIFLTACVRPGDEVRLRALGAAGVIAKPFDPTRLARQITELRKRHD